MRGFVVNEDRSNIDRIRQSWFIDLDWYQLNRRSFTTLAQRCLCSRCRERLQVETGEITAADLLMAITDCCSREPGFITGGLPILESIFRLFLANGNQSLDLETLGEQLREWRGEGLYRIPTEVLSRLLESDRYYGLRQVAG